VRKSEGLASLLADLPLEPIVLGRKAQDLLLALEELFLDQQSPLSLVEYQCDVGG
jgi:hypothetical protein